MLLFLAGYANGHRRKRAWSGAKLPQKLPEPAWFTDRLRGNALLDMLQRIPKSQLYSAVDVCKASISAIAYVKPGAVYCGPLTPAPWDKEADLLWKYHGCPKASYTVQVSDFVTLESPVDVASARNHRGNISLMQYAFQCRVQTIGLNTKVVRPADAGTQHHLGDIMASWGLEDKRECLPDVPVLWVPECILGLLGKEPRMWRTLLLHLESNHRGTQKVNLTSLQFLRQHMVWPSHEQFERLLSVQGSFQVPEAVSLANELVDFLIEVMRQNMEKLQPGNLQNFDEQLKQGMLALHGFASGYSKVQSSYTGGKRTAEDMINAVRAAQHVRNRNKMQELQERLLGSFVPQPLQKAAQKMMQKALHGSTISRAQVSLNWFNMFLNQFCCTELVILRLMIPNMC